MTDDTLTRYPGVYQRPDSNIYQFGLRVPDDLRQHFSGSWAVRRSLGTSSLREANDKAKALHAHWAEQFTSLRTGKPAHVNLADLRAKLLTYAEQKYLPSIDRLSAGYTQEERRSATSSAAWNKEDIEQGLASGYVSPVAEQWLDVVLPLLGYQRSTVTDAEGLAFYAMLQELEHEAYWS